MSNSDSGFMSGLFMALIGIPMMLMLLGGAVYVLLSPRVDWPTKVMAWGMVFLLWRYIRADRQLEKGTRVAPNYAGMFMSYLLVCVVLWIVGLFAISFCLMASEVADTKDIITTTNMIIWTVIVFGGVAWYLTAGELRKRNRKQDQNRSLE